MLVTNIATYVLILVLLTVVPILPAMVMSRVLSTGLAKDRSERAESVTSPEKSLGSRWSSLDVD